MALGAALGLGLVARDAAALCVAGVALCSNGLTALTLACSQQKKVGGDAACQCLHYLLSCLVTFYILLLEQ